MTSALTSDQLERFAKRVEADPTARMMQNALSTTDVDKVVLDHARTLSVPRSMSHHLDDWECHRPEEQSGRCWMFAGLNLLRVGVARAIGVKEFEFSQNYLQFWDKLERANYCLESILATADPTPTTARSHTCWRAGRGRRAVEHVPRPGGQARPGPQGGHAGDRVVVEDRAS